jgi:hypothetical protein
MIPSLILKELKMSGNEKLDIDAAIERAENAAYEIDFLDDREEDICGESSDHVEVTIYEDEELVQWMCRRCGAEGYEDKI